MTTATCRGTNSFGIAGARSPLGCGGGGTGIQTLSTIGSERSWRSRWNWQNAATRPLPSPRCRSALASATDQSPASSAARSSNVSGAGAAAPGGRHARQTAPPDATANAECGPGSPQRAQSVKLGAQPATDERAQQVGVEHQAGRVVAAGQRLHGADQQPVLLQGRLALGLDQPVRRLEHDRAGGVERVVLADPAPERPERLGLRDDVEVAARAQLQVDVHERLEPRPEPRRRAAHALADRTDLAVRPGQEGDDAVGLPQLVGAQDDRLVAVEAHRAHSPPRHPHRAPGTRARPRVRCDHRACDGDGRLWRRPTLAARRVRTRGDVVPLPVGVADYQLGERVPAGRRTSRSSSATRRRPPSPASTRSVRERVPDPARRVRRPRPPAGAGPRLARRAPARHRAARRPRRPGRGGARPVRRRRVRRRGAGQPRLVDPLRTGSWTGRTPSRSPRP